VSLRAFHLVFIALSIVLAAFLAAWAVGQYQARHEVVYVGVVALSLATAAVLGRYAVAFQRKTKDL
jgi:hypothetical protein